MSDAIEILQAYMDDDPNLGTGNGINGVPPVPRDGTPPDPNRMEGITTGTNATPGPATAPVADGREEDVEMTNPGKVVTGIGTLLRRRGLLSTTWFSTRSDSEIRKRKDRSPSPVAAADGGDQSTDTAGAHKKLRTATSPVISSGSPQQEVATDSVARGDSEERSSRSGSEAPEQSSGTSSMPGALSLTTVGPSSSQSTASAPATQSLTTNGPSTSVTTGLTVVAVNNASASSHTGSTSATGLSGGHGSSATTTTPPGSPPRATTDTGNSHSLRDGQVIPVRDKPPPSSDRPVKRMPITLPGGPSGDGGSNPPPVTSSAGGSSSSSTTEPNNSDPWRVLVQQFDGVRTEIHTMGTHMHTMNNNIGRLDNAVGIMTEQHTELMSVLRMTFQRPSNPAPPAGQPPAPPAAGPHSAVVPYSPAVPVAHQPPRANIPPPAAPRQSSHKVPRLSTSSHKNSSRTQASSDDEMDLDEGDLGDTEGEIPEPLPVPVRAAKLKLKGMPKARDPVRKALLDDISLMARKYMGREPESDDDEDYDVPFFDESMIPSRDEVGAFNGRGGQCCTIDNFRPDLLGTPRSTWNQSVAQVFAKEYVKEATAQSKNVIKVERAFGVHMKTLINSYKTFQASDTTNEAKRRARRRYMRKSYAHQRRLLTVASHDGMKHHLWIIQALGVRGMSSDESEHEGTQVWYRRTTLAWRNPTLDTFFHVIDVFHDASRFTDGVDKSSKSGSHVHLRLPARKVSERAAVPGLPSAAYNPAWLKDLSDFFRNRLNISNVQYQFTHTPEVMKEMMQVLRQTPSDPTQQIPSVN